MCCSNRHLLFSKSCLAHTHTYALGLQERCLAHTHTYVLGLQERWRYALEASKSGAAKFSKSCLAHTERMLAPGLQVLQTPAWTAETSD
jgi:hypothetical protein